MTTSAITVGGTLQSDGLTLQLEQKLTLPPGRVTVTVQSTAQGSGPTMLDVLEGIHRSQRQRGCKPMTDEEMAAEIAAIRRNDDEYDKRWQQIESETDSKTGSTDPS